MCRKRKKIQNVILKLSLQLEAKFLKDLLKNPSKTFLKFANILIACKGGSVFVVTIFWLNIFFVCDYIKILESCNLKQFVEK
jgi:hypothetical protein